MRVGAGGILNRFVHDRYDGTTAVLVGMRSKFMIARGLYKKEAQKICGRLSTDTIFCRQCTPPDYLSRAELRHDVVTLHSHHTGQHSPEERRNGIAIV